MLLGVFSLMLGFTHVYCFHGYVVIGHIDIFGYNMFIARFFLGIFLHNIWIIQII